MGELAVNELAVKALERLHRVQRRYYFTSRTITRTSTHKLRQLVKDLRSAAAHIEALADQMDNDDFRI